MLPRVSSLLGNPETSFSRDASPLFQRNKRKKEEGLSFLSSLLPIEKRADMKKKLVSKFGAECGKNLILPPDKLQSNRLLILGCKDCTNFTLYSTYRSAKSNTAKQEYPGAGFVCDLTKCRLEHFSLVDGIEEQCRSKGHMVSMVRMPLSKHQLILNAHQL